MSVDDRQPESASSTADVPKHDSPDSCPNCGGGLTRDSSHTSRNRHTTIYTCSGCGMGASAVISQQGALNESTKQKLQKRREAVEHGLSAYRLAAFVSEGAPNGEYIIQRIDGHAYRVNLPENALSGQVKALARRFSQAEDHIIVQIDDMEITVEDDRFTDNGDVATDGGVVVNLPQPVGPEHPDQLDKGHTAGKNKNSLPPVKDVDDRRTRRAKEEAMNVSLSRKGGIYDVESESGNIYQVDILEETCTCPDHTKREARCKHIRRVDLEIKSERVPTPDGRAP